MPDVIPGVKGAIYLALIISLYYAFLARIPTYAFISRQAYLMDTTEVLLAKAIGEAFSYAYYLEANKEFNAMEYSDEDLEIWEVPPWFSYPQAETNASCALTHGEGLSCVIWNLKDYGTLDLSNPPACPPVEGVPSVNIDYLTTLTISDSNVSDILSKIKSGYQTRPGLDEILGAYGVSYTLDNPHISGSGPTYTSSSTNASIMVGLFTRSFQIPGWYFIVSIDQNVEEARCICYRGNTQVYSIPYSVTTYYLHVQGFLGGQSGIKLLDEYTHILTYFNSGGGGIASNVDYCFFEFDWEKKLGIQTS